jgi:hypothetical protein
MTLSRRLAGICAAALIAGSHLSAQAQRNDSYTWKLGLNAGTMTFQTHIQDYKWAFSGGAHILAMAKRGGVMLGVDEAFGSDEKAGSGLILFNDVRRYQILLMAFPTEATVEPYFGVGIGIMQVINPRVDPTVSDPVTKAALLSGAQDAAASGFWTGLFGVQGRAGRMTVFGQAQIASAPGDDKLLKGTSYSIVGGVRIGLGSAREGLTSNGH